jgi:DNA-binding MarR family transcriptional regulator
MAKQASERAAEQAAKMRAKKVSKSPKGGQATRPDGADLGRDLSDAVVMFHEAIAQRLGLTAADHKALGILAREGPFTAGKLADRIGLTPGAVTGLVDRLERAGLVHRRRDATDRRRVHIVAVPRPSDQHAAAFGALSKGMRGFLRRYSPDQLATIDDFCRQTIRVLRHETRRLSGRPPEGKEGQ